MTPPLNHAPNNLHPGSTGTATGSTKKPISKAASELHIDDDGNSRLLVLSDQEPTWAERMMDSNGTPFTMVNKENAKSHKESNKQLHNKGVQGQPSHKSIPTAFH